MFVRFLFDDRREFADERAYEYAIGMDTRNEAHETERHAELRPEHRSRRHRLQQVARRSAGQSDIRRHSHQHVRRIRIPSPESTRFHFPKPLQHRSSLAARQNLTPKQRRRCENAKPVERKHEVSGLARRAETQFHRLHKLRQHRRDDGGRSQRVRVGTRRQRPSVPVGPTERRRGRQNGGAASGVHGGDQGQGSDSELGPAGEGSEPPFGRSVSDSQRVELDARRRLRRRSDDLLAVLRGAAGELQVRLHLVGDGAGDKRRRKEG